MTRAAAVDFREGGFTYIGLLILVALIAIALAGTAEVVSTAQKREREQELLFVGTQYARAIASYRSASPGSEAYPTSLEQLLEDKRLPVMRRHLRKLYADPVTNGAPWGLVLGPNNGIVGVYSRSLDQPLKRQGFSKEYEQFTDTESYSQWKFIGAGAVAAKPTGSAPQPGG
ncbi:MAG TPA: type II secretion system protein [Burkholderiales bacterium]|nr:type II secretion system protein [Burkholderiales bacterium]